MFKRFFSIMSTTSAPTNSDVTEYPPNKTDNT